MADLGPVAWPPAPIRTERLVLRESEARDRAAFVELIASPAVGAFVGGCRPRAELEREMAEVPGRRPGVFVVERDGAMIGTVTLGRRDVGRPGRIRPEPLETDLGYLFLPQAWGHGYAAEACSAALAWFTRAFPGEPVVLCTQTANDRAMRLAAKLGFTEVERFEEYGAEQWFGVWSTVTLAGAVVRLRAAVHGDVPALSEIRSTPEVYRRWGGGDDLPGAVAADLADPGTRVLVVLNDNRVVGAIQWSEEEDPDYRHAGIDIYLAPSVHGRGLGTDAVRTLARHLIDDLGHHRLVIDPAADNHAAIRCYAKAGFRPVGIMRKYERAPDGNWHDGMLMDLLADELT